jgi:hypothetical protein
VKLASKKWCYGKNTFWEETLKNTFEDLFKFNKLNLGKCPFIEFGFLRRLSYWKYGINVSLVRK